MPTLSACRDAACSLALAVLAAGACDRQPQTASAGPSPSPVPVDNQIHGGGVTTTVPARTGSQASGVTGSDTVIGAPKPGETGLATAHAGP